jgi:erythronate-4-phosphate dehydrogenase
MNKPVIIIDDAIPFIRGVFEPYANACYSKGSEFDSKNADILITRTRTKCNAALLDGTHVKLIATATIGTDHIDLDYCKLHEIKVVSAPGCNSGGVMQYVFTALFALAEKYKINLYPDRPLTIGVIGVGHVGTKVAALGEHLGFRVLRNDPPKEKLQKELNEKYYPLDYLLKNSDIVTLHVPLDESTREIANDDFFSKMKRGAIFFNTCRGGVMSNSALLNALDVNNINGSERGDGILRAAVIDTWNSEPSISIDLLQAAAVATPHIAGYSYEGKVNGTTVVVRKVAEYLNIPELKKYTVGSIKDMQGVKTERTPHINFAGLSQGEIAEKLLRIFPIWDLDSKLRYHPENFEKLRSNYEYRREFTY